VIGILLTIKHLSIHIEKGLHIDIERMYINCIITMTILLFHNYCYCYCYCHSYDIIKSNNNKNKFTNHRKKYNKLNMMTDDNNDNEIRTILPVLSILNNERSIILASGSPRRRELLNLIGLNNFKVIASNFDEQLDKSLFKDASQYCLTTAKHKALDVIENNKFKEKGTILISSDTIVEIDNKILEKPNSQYEAYRMLNMLRGRWHQVHTSVCIFSNMNTLESPLIEVDSFVSTSNIKFSNFSDDDLMYYISQTREPYDKAGSYGIQGLGSMFVESIKGDYFTIMGFPIFEFSKTLHSLYAKKLV